LQKFTFFITISLTPLPACALSIKLRRKRGSATYGPRTLTNSVAFHPQLQGFNLHIFRLLTEIPIVALSSSPPISNPSNHGRPHQIPTSYPVLRFFSPRTYQAIYPSHTSPHKQDSHRISINASICGGIARYTMGRPRTCEAEDKIMVQVREFTKSGGLQGPRGVSCLD